MEETVTLDNKGRLVLPKRIRTAAKIEVNHDLLVRSVGVGRVELVDPDVLLAKAQEIGSKKLAGWKESDHEADKYLEKLVKKHR